MAGGWAGGAGGRDAVVGTHETFAKVNYFEQFPH